ncbi:CemA family [Synechococcus sp. PCC 7502]|uniref:hypothetical protein n=1 Tax=Synechococcus sp. PCC 7502 TaxID=1173263 RepID=UPI00029FDB12|nr:hypothetical protein [Synechococcus sp. PCC 7502]AFY73643.1 CemA family [Synechococcus sp. PCC 7502]
MKGGFKNFWSDLNRWVKDTPARAIDLAYKAAVAVKKLEDDYFEGNPISRNWGYADNTYSLFQTQLQNALITIDVRLAEYRLSSRIPNFLKSDAIKPPVKAINNGNGNTNGEYATPTILQKLVFIDLILSRYRANISEPVNETAASHQSAKLLEGVKGIAPKTHNNTPKSPIKSDANSVSMSVEHSDFTPKYVEQTYVPISILQSLERIRRNITSGDKYEQELVQDARQTRRRINIGIRFIIILVVVTISTQQVSKNFLYKPLVKSWESRHKVEFQFSKEIEERALAEYREERAKVEFQALLSGRPDEVSGQKVEEILQEKVQEIYKLYQDLSLEGVQNLFADMTAGFVVYAILLTGKKEVKIIKQFIDETIHGLNDNAKAFLIIVITDTFVGYHSSHGWEVLIDTFSVHFGLPENRDLTLAFIATVPVFLDGLIKFWVFQALTSSSPSTAAIYDEMNK